jgi:hypothetical protein
MALAIGFRTIDHVISGLAKIDILNALVCGKGSDVIGDDYFMAPYGIMKMRNGVYAIAYTGYKVRNAHDNAIELMAEQGLGGIWYVSPKEVEKKPMGTSFREHMWAGGDDIDESLYETTIHNAAKFLKNDCIPENWKEQQSFFSGTLEE